MPIKRSISYACREIALNYGLKDIECHNCGNFKWADYSCNANVSAVVSDGYTYYCGGWRAKKHWSEGYTPQMIEEVKERKRAWYEYNTNHFKKTMEKMFGHEVNENIGEGQILVPEEFEKEILASFPKTIMRRMNEIERLQSARKPKWQCAPDIKITPQLTGKGIIPLTDGNIVIYCAKGDERYVKV